MYMLSIGLQMAGPDLNPQTFEAGMFAYPPKSGPFGLWKFGPGVRTAANDVREIYWDPGSIATYNGQAGPSHGAHERAPFPRGHIPDGPPTRPAEGGCRWGTTSPWTAPE